MIRALRCELIWNTPQHRDTTNWRAGGATNPIYCVGIAIGIWISFLRINQGVQGGSNLANLGEPFDVNPDSAMLLSSSATYPMYTV